MKAWMLTLCLICGCSATHTPPRTSQRQERQALPAAVGINPMLGYPDFGGALASAKKTPEDRERYLDLLRDLGSPPVREWLMDWSRAEPRPGAAYDFSLSDELVQAAQVRNIELLALCQGTPSWAVARPSPSGFELGVPAHVQDAAFRNFVRAFVERYDGDRRDDMPGLRRPVHAYEFMQEMEDVPPEEYAYWMRAFYETVKDADPQAVVSLGSLRSPGLAMAGEEQSDYATYFERLLSSQGLAGPEFPYFDVVSFHHYPDSYNRQDRGRQGAAAHVSWEQRNEEMPADHLAANVGRPFDEPLAYIRSVLSQHNIDRPIWVTELGCAGGHGQEVRQAQRLVQWTLRARSVGIERVYIYCLYDHHWTGNEKSPESLGLVREAGAAEPIQRKAAFQAMHTLFRELSEHPQVTLQDSNVYRLVGDGVAPVFAVWRDPRSDDQQQWLRAGWWEVHMLDGRRSQDQGTHIELTDEPMFVKSIKSPFLSKSPFLKDNFQYPFDQDFQNSTPGEETSKNRKIEKSK